MSEEKKPRSKQEIQVEYNGLCAKAGYIQYQIFIAESELEELNKHIRDLNWEAAAVVSAEKEAEAKATEVVSNA